MGYIEKGESTMNNGTLGHSMWRNQSKMSKKLVTVSHCHETNLPQALSALSTRVFGESESKRGAGSEDVLLNPKNDYEWKRTAPVLTHIISGI